MTDYRQQGKNYNESLPEATKRLVEGYELAYNTLMLSAFHLGYTAEIQQGIDKIEKMAYEDELIRIAFKYEDHVCGLAKCEQDGYVRNVDTEDWSVYKRRRELGAKFNLKG